MDKILDSLKTPEECVAFAKIFTELARAARHRAIDLRVKKVGNMSEVEAELWGALFAYEELLSIKNGRRTPASRTRQMIQKYGIIGTAERAVNRTIDAKGYTDLVDMGFQDKTFEAIIVKYTGAFMPEAVEQAKRRLTEYHAISEDYSVEF
jgi:hypothetical protein